MRQVAGNGLWVVLHLVVFGGAFGAAQGLTRAWPLSALASAPWPWPAVGLVAVGLACPWLAVAHRRGGGGRGRWVAAACAVGFVLAGAGALWPTAGANHRWLAPALALGVPVAALALMVRPLARGLAVLGALGTAAGVVWVLRAPAAAEEPLIAASTRWFRNEANRALAGGAVAAVLLVGAAWALAILGIRRRKVWLAAAAVSAATWPAYAFLAPTLWSNPRGLARLYPGDQMAAEPYGPFAGAASESVLGWRWVRNGNVWRQAMLVQPPCRVEVDLPASGEGDLPIGLTIPLQWFAEEDVGVEVRCTVRSGDGREVAKAECWLPASLARQRLAGRWEELALDVSAAQGSRAVLTLTAEAANGRRGSVPLLAVAAGPLRPARPDPGLNLVIILVDTLRSDRLHCYGYPEATSPAIDRLAGQGTLFERTISSCSETVPSVASLFTGAFAATHGMVAYSDWGRLALPTLAEAFRAAGVATAGVSANHLVYPPTGVCGGFDEFVDSHFALSGEYPRAAWVTDWGLALLRRLNGRRFFLYLHYMDPHYTYDPPPEWLLFGRWDHERYLGEIRYCDEEIGRFLGELDRLGRADDTLVVFIADHGEAFGEHGVTGHGFTVYREEVQVPLILRLPGRIPAGRRVRTQVRTIDAHATIREVMGLETPRFVEGESLLPLLADGGDTGDRVAYSELARELTRRVWIGVNDGRYKAALEVRSGRTFLYDVQNDPGEKADLAAERPEQAAAMRRDIDRFLRARRPPSAAPRPLTDEERRRLRALGYLAPGR